MEKRSFLRLMAIFDSFPENINTLIVENNFKCLDIFKNLHTVNPCNSLSFFHSNIRSIAKNFNQLLVLLSMYTFQFDIIVLFESFVVYNVDMYGISGMKRIRMRAHSTKMMVS